MIDLTIHNNTANEVKDTGVNRTLPIIYREILINLITLTNGKCTSLCFSNIFSGTTYQISTSYWQIGRLTYNTQSNCLGNVGTVIGMFRTAV